MANCIDNVLSKFPEANREALQAVFDGMSRDAKDGFLDGAGNMDKDFMDKAQARIEAYDRGVLIAKAKTAANILKAAKNRGFIANEVFEGKKADGIQAVFTGTNKNVIGAKEGISQRTKGNEGALLSGFFKELSDSKVKGLDKIVQSGALDEQIVMEKHDLANGGKGGVSGDQNALIIAKAWENLHAAQLQMKNDAGAFVNKLDGRVMERVYDRAAMLKAGKEKFTKFMLDNVDSDKSFKKDFYTRNAHEVIDGIWKNVTEGRGVDEDLKGDDSRGALMALDRPANLARQMEQGRTIHLKTAKAEFEFMRDFGAQSVGEDIGRSTQSAARKSAMIERLGTNPELAYRDMAKGLSAADQKMLDRHWSNVNGEANIPGISAGATASRNLRMLADVRSLGTAIFSHINNIGSRVGLMQMQGEGFVSAMADSLGQTLANVSPGQRNEFMHMTGIGADSHIGNFYDKFGTTEGGAHGWANYLHQQYFKLTGIRAMSSVHEGANAQMLSGRLGFHADKNFSELNPQMANVLQKYGLGPAEWDLVRAGVDDGYASNRGVESVSKEQVQAIMKGAGLNTEGRLLGKFQRDTSAKLTNYFVDRSAIGTGKPGAFEKAAFLNRGHIEDSLEGQAFRFVGQFKGYGATMVSQFGKAYYNEALAGKTIAEGAATLAPLLVSMTALGYVSYAAKEMAKGRSAPMANPLENPTEAAKITVESMIKGGAGGLYADALLGDFDSRHGRSFLSALGGPVVGQANDVADLITELKNAGESGDPSKVKLSAFARFGLNNTIGNMPVLRQGLDYLFLNHMAETLNPGVHERMKARMAQQGQDYTFGDKDALQ